MADLAHALSYSELRQQDRTAPEDVEAATELAVRIHAADWSVFPHRRTHVRFYPSVSPSTIARYVPEQDGYPDGYIVFVDGLHARLELEEVAVLVTHRPSSSLIPDVPGHVLDAIAVHEARHRLETRLAGTLRLWTPDHLTPECAEDIRVMMGEFPGMEKHPLELDARIVEYLRMRELLMNGVEPVQVADAVWREPQ